MAKIDFAKAKTDIAEIMVIVKTVPEALQQRCFELLFNLAFQGPVKPAAEEKADKKKQEEEPDDEKNEKKKFPGNVLGFMHRHTLESGDVTKLFMLEHEPMLQVYKLPEGNMAKAQLYKVLMILLENGLLNNSLSAPYSEIRTTLKEEGLHDTNFNKVMKKNHDLFKGAISKKTIDENGVVELSGQGMKKLAEVIRELGQ